MKIPIAIADDHQLFLKSVSMLIDHLPQFYVVAEAVDGAQLLQRLESAAEPPAIVLLDVDMPNLDGAATAVFISQRYPLARIVALSMKSDDASVITMLRAGACAYLLKDLHPDELEKALTEIHQTGYYNADVANVNYRRLLHGLLENEQPGFTPREKEFLQLACSDLTYKQIAAQMSLAERTIDGYRESLFGKLSVKSRTGMALEAVRRGLVQL